jgi:hypothetical protein
LDEVPRVEAELRKDGTENADQNPERGTHTATHTEAGNGYRLPPRRSTRKRGRDENAGDEPPPKRPKSGGRNTDYCEAQYSSIRAPGPTRSRRWRRDPGRASCLPPSEDICPQLRRSARIAARKLAQTQAAATLSRDPIPDAPGMAGNGAQRPAAGGARRQRRKKPQEGFRPT